MSVEVLLGILGSATSLAGFIAAYIGYARRDDESGTDSGDGPEIRPELAAAVLRTLGQEATERNVELLRLQLIEARDQAGLQTSRMLPRGGKAGGR